MTIEGTSQPFVLPRYRYFRAHITIKHWQLRDLVCRGRDDDEVLYPSDSKVHGVDLNTGKDSVVADFEFDPRCIQAVDDLVAVGGVHEMRSYHSLSSPASASSATSHRGLFGLLNRVTGSQLNCAFGDFINNDLKLYRELGGSGTQYKSIVCNNDCCMYFLDIQASGYRVSETFKLNAALNHCAVSPDQKTVVACGDSPSVSIVHKGECGWQTAHTLDTRSDLGFSVEFHPAGNIFAVAFQQGVTKLFDLRNYSTCLGEIKSSRPVELMGAFRCLKFLDGPEDLLFISEQMSRVHMVDLRHLDRHQILNIPSRFGDSGLADDSTGYTVFDHQSSSSSLSAVPSVTTASHLATLPAYAFVDPAARVESIPFLNSPAALTRYNRLGASDFGVSGLCLTSHGGGSLMVGTDSGIGMWRIDGWSRRSFPSYAVR